MLESAAILPLIANNYFRLDAQGIILDYKLETIHNLYNPPEIIVGQYIWELLPPQATDKIQQAIAQALQTESPVNFEYTHTTPAGKQKYAARLLSVAQEVIILIRDITPVRETPLLESEHKFQQIVENANNIIFGLTPDGIFSYVSPNWTEILGHEIAEVEGKSFVPFVHPDDVPLCTDYLSTVVKTGQRQNPLEYRTKHKDGSWRWHTSSASAIKDEKGNVLYFVGIAYDITDRKRTEAELAQRVKLADFRSEVDSILWQSYTLENLMQGCTQAMVKHLNAAFARIWTLNKQDNVLELQVSSGMYTHIDGPHRFVPVGKFKIGLIAEEGQPHITNSVQTDPRVGNKEWAKQEGMIAFAGYPLIVEGETLGVLAMFSRQVLNESTLEALSITANEIAIGIKRKHTEEELRKSEAKYRIAAQIAQEKAQQLEVALLELQQTQTQLIQTEKMSSLGQLVAGIAHEINNPVNFIHGNLIYTREYVGDLLYLIELYRQHYYPSVPEIQQQIAQIDLDFIAEDLPKILNSMDIGTERIQQIVLSLRNFSRLDEEGMKPTDIHEGIDNTLLLLQHRLKPRNDSERIEVMKEYGNLPKILCNAGQINQVFMNLLTNAIDALEESVIDSQKTKNPQIVIRTELTTDNQVIIRIADNGPGMTEQVRSRLFDPFFTTKPVGKGTGMGLSISYQIVVTNHQGQIQCISAPGKGTEFIITLPLYQLTVDS
ncbi:PAS domain S-box protein [Anabaena azotica]|uniref:histidine kinase n=1 Tax=Anabaena azotica FACHB-119 TaxID=947527 RepID=A0ABR8DAS6_9NOST|nr:PAS domain S-box protein [Anabaena azotica]MBD2503450.1 PAS domain S-box protein [Anabaena azotica FACHB-119]